MSFSVGQIFKKKYPPEAAVWCNENRAYITEIEAQDSVRCFQIVAVPEPTIEEVKAKKLIVLNTAFESAAQTAHLMSSVGFEIDADEISNRNISELIVTMEAGETETVSFCDYNNVFHDVTLSDLKTMQLEVIRNGQALYAKKWLFREAIHAAETVEALNAIAITFDLETGGTDGQTT